MSEPTPMVGYKIEKAHAWWVTCEECGANELVYGLFAPTDASTWATAHITEEHPERLGTTP